MDKHNLAALDQSRYFYRLDPIDKQSNTCTLVSSVNNCLFEEYTQGPLLYLEEWQQILSINEVGNVLKVNYDLHILNMHPSTHHSMSSRL